MVIGDSQLNVVSYKEHKAKSLTSLCKETDLNSRSICSDYGTKQEPGLGSAGFGKNQERNSHGKCA